MDYFVEALSFTTFADTLQFLASLIILTGMIWATHSDRICDGILVKIGLGSIGLGAAANMLNQSGHAKLWILYSIALTVVFAVVRVIYARLRNKNPVFIAKLQRENKHERRHARAA